MTGVNAALWLLPPFRKFGPFRHWFKDESSPMVTPPHLAPPPPYEWPNVGQLPPSSAMVAITNEIDALKARVAELEAVHG